VAISATGWRGGEVCDGGSLPFVGAGFDLGGQRIAAPALFERLPGVPKAGGDVLQLLE
jgi:hypothetical protein